MPLYVEAMSLKAISTPIRLHCKKVGHYMPLLRVRPISHHERGHWFSGTCRGDRASILLEQVGGKEAPWLAEIAILGIASIKER